MHSIHAGSVAIRAATQASTVPLVLFQTSLRRLYRPMFVGAYAADIMVVAGLVILDRIHLISPYASCPLQEFAWPSLVD